MGKSTEQRIWDRVKIAQLILLAAAFLLFLGGCGREGAPADAAARTGATIQTGTATRTEAVTQTGTATRTETTAPKPGLQMQIRWSFFPEAWILKTSAVRMDGRQRKIE